MLVNNYVYGDKFDVNGDVNGGIYVKMNSLIELLKRQEEILSLFDNMGMIEETVLEEPKVSKLLGKTVAKTLIDITGIDISQLKLEANNDPLLFSATWDLVIKQMICSKCAYCKLCDKGEFQQFINEEINNNFECGSSNFTNFIIYKEVEELYPTKELHEYIFDTMSDSDSDKEMSSQEKYNFCKILIQAEYEKYKKKRDLIFSL